MCRILKIIITDPDPRKKQTLDPETGFKKTVFDTLF
jgi:hypothetical protein